MLPNPFASFLANQSRRTLSALLLACPLGLSSGPAHAQTPEDAHAIYLQGASASGNTHALTVGVNIPWPLWRRALWGGELRGYWDVYASHWRVRRPDSPDHLSAIGATPTLRLRLDGGHSPWFVETGLGMALTDGAYVTPYKSFSTRWNFASHLGLGRSLGTHGEDELVLRLQHFSNASVKKPNPGENFLQLRYARHF